MKPAVTEGPRRSFGRIQIAGGQIGVPDAHLTLFTGVCDITIGAHDLVVLSRGPGELMARPSADKAVKWLKVFSFQTRHRCHPHARTTAREGLRRHPQAGRLTPRSRPSAATGRGWQKACEPAQASLKPGRHQTPAKALALWRRSGLGGSTRPPSAGPDRGGCRAGTRRQAASRPGGIRRLRPQIGRRPWPGSEPGTSACRWCPTCRQSAGERRGLAHPKASPRPASRPEPAPVTSQGRWPQHDRAGQDRRDQPARG